MEPGSARLRVGNVGNCRGLSTFSTSYSFNKIDIPLNEQNTCTWFTGQSKKITSQNCTLGQICWNRISSEEELIVKLLWKM